MSVAAVAAAPRSLSGRDIPTLESLYEAAGGVNFTPGWVPRKKPILGANRGRNSSPRTGPTRTPRPVWMPPAG